MRNLACSDNVVLLEGLIRLLIHLMFVKRIPSRHSTEKVARTDIRSRRKQEVSRSQSD